MERGEVPLMHRINSWRGNEKDNTLSFIATPAGTEEDHARHAALTVQTRKWPKI